jgi:hypothetical protein
MSPADLSPAYVDPVHLAPADKIPAPWECNYSNIFTVFVKF